MRAFTSASTVARSSPRAAWDGEVEAQPVGRDQRALLRDVLAEPIAQRLVQQMRRGVVGAHAARRVVDLQLDRVADLQRAAATLPRWTKRSPSFFCVSRPR
jgi:hypothetical protein